MQLTQRLIYGPRIFLARIDSFVVFWCVLCLITTYVDSEISRNLWKSLEIVGIAWNSLEIFGNLWGSLGHIFWVKPFLNKSVSFLAVEVQIEPNGPQWPPMAPIGPQWPPMGAHAGPKNAGPIYESLTCGGEGGTTI